MIDKTAKERMQRYRNKKRNGATDSVTEQIKSVTPNVTAYHPIMYALTDSIKRKKLEAICKSLSNHNVLDKVYLGCGAYSLNMDTVSELLEVTGG